MGKFSLEPVHKRLERAWWFDTEPICARPQHLRLEFRILVLVKDRPRNPQPQPRYSHLQSLRGIRHRRVDFSSLQRIVARSHEVPDIKVWYRRLTLYVAPSRNEGFGLTPLEAMASRTAVVASDAGASAELIAEGETGSVVAAGDSEALTRAIAPYIADPGLAVAHGENALRHVRANFALEKEANAIGAIYDRLLGGNR